MKELNCLPDLLSWQYSRPRPATTATDHGAASLGLVVSDKEWDSESARKPAVNQAVGTQTTKSEGVWSADMSTCYV